MSARDTQIAGLEGGRVRVAASQIDKLESRLQGNVLWPGSLGWTEAVQIWNGMVAKTPALVLQPASARDVSQAVRFARDKGLLLSVKGGGHNIAGTAIAEDGLTLDMSLMRNVTVDGDRKLVHVGPGCLLQDVDRSTQKLGQATVLGFVSETGVAGLTLGGGIGYLSRRFGWAVDNLEEVEIVTADAQVQLANRGENEDLFWAIRGGGGNLGVVTRFTFRLHDVGPIISGGLTIWGAERIDDVLATYRGLTESAPRELTAAAVVMHAPPAPFVPPEWHGRPVIALLVCHSGENPERDLAPLRALGQPVVDLIAERPYVEQQSMLDETEPNGNHYYWKTEFLPRLSSEFLDMFRDNALRMTGQLSNSVIFHLGGAPNERDWDDGAVGNRDAAYVTGFAGQWTPEERADEHVSWVREAWKALRPHSTGGNYVNFQLAEDGMARTAEAYGRNYERLQRVKAQYDPANLFRVNRNVPPSTSAVAA